MRKRKRALRCPDCDSSLSDFFGIISCPGCKTRLVRNIHDRVPRAVKAPQVSASKSASEPRTERSYPIVVEDGKAFYVCVCCFTKIPVSELMTQEKTKTADGRIKVSAKVQVSQKVVGFEYGSPSVYHGHRGPMWTIKDNFRPLIKSGPMCRRCR